MKSPSVFLILLSIQFSIKAQIIPETNTHEEYKKHNVKLVRTVYQPDKNAIIDEEQILFEKEFNENSQLVRMYQLFIWEAVSYSYTTTYKYAESGQLIVEDRKQEILNLIERDQDYIRIFGSQPLNQRIFYYYNDDGQLSKKDIFNYSKAFSDSLSSQSILYEYENGLKIKEQSSSPDDKIFNRNYQLVYQYDSLGNLINKTRAFGDELSLRRSTSYQYDQENQLIEERTIDEDFSHNNAHLKYTYNSDGSLDQKLAYDAELEDFEILTTYAYDNFGRAIEGDRKVQFEYDSKGLIISESWIEPSSEEKITFVTSYEYF